VRHAQTGDIVAVPKSGAGDLREDHGAWVGIDCLEEFLGIDDPRLVDAALAFASAKVLAVVSQPTVSRHRVNGTAP